MTAVSRRSLVLVLALAAGAGILFALVRTTVPAPRAPLAVLAPEPLVEERVEERAEPGELPAAESPRLRAELSKPAPSADERAYAIWRELSKRPKHRAQRARRRAETGERGAALVLELGALARDGNRVALELLARLVADPGRGWARSEVLGEALAGVESELVPRAIRRGFELASSELPETAQAAIAYLELAAQHGGVDGARLLLEVHDGADEACKAAALEALARTSDRSLRSAWLERLQGIEPEHSEPLLRALLAWRDADTEHALRALVHAPHLDAERRAAIARGLAGDAQPEIALALAADFWTTRGDPENAMYLEAARACLANPAIPRESLERVVEPIALELLRDPDNEARRAALGMLGSPPLATERTLDVLVQARAALVEAGLRKESRTAIQAQLKNLRAVRRADRVESREPEAPAPGATEARPPVRAPRRRRRSP